MPKYEAKYAVPQRDLARFEPAPERAEQRRLAGLLALVRAHRQVAHDPGGQRDDRDDPGHREPQPGALGPRLREGRLVGRGVGHRHGGPVDQRHPAALPGPLGGGAALDRPGRLMDQPDDDLLREPPPRLAVGGGLRAQVFRPSRASQTISRATAARQEWSGSRTCERKTERVTSGV